VEKKKSRVSREGHETIAQGGEGTKEVGLRQAKKSYKEDVFGLIFLVKVRTSIVVHSPLKPPRPVAALS